MLIKEEEDFVNLDMLIQVEACAFTSNALFVSCGK